MSEKTKIPEAALRNAEMVKKELQEKGQYMSLTRGPSMRPMLRQHKDVVVIVPVTRPLKKYDIPLYMTTYKDDLVLHRILKVRENDYVIRGDNTYFYEYIPKENVVGVLKEFYRDGKHINCETNKGFRIYSVLNTKLYFPRKIWKGKIRPFLGKIKRSILGTNKSK